MEFKDKINKRRKELGLTLEEVGEAIGVSKATVLRYENGDIKNMGHDKIAALTKVLKISPSYLFGFDENKTEEEMQIIDMIYERPEISALLSVAKNSSKEEIEQLVNMLKAFKKP